MEAEFHFCCGIDEYCKCGQPGFCRGNNDHLYIESYINCDSRIEELFSRIDAKPFIDKFNDDYKYEDYTSPWMNILDGLAHQHLNELLLWIVKEGIDPFSIYNNDYSLRKILGYFSQMMKKSLEGLDENSKNSFPDKMLTELGRNDYSSLLNKALYVSSGIEYEEDEVVPYIKFSEENILPNCGFCYTCEFCLKYSIRIKTASKYLVEDDFYQPLSDKLSYILFEEAITNLDELSSANLSWVKILPGKDTFFINEINSTDIGECLDILRDYLKLIIGIILLKSYVWDQEKDTVIGKHIFVEQVFNWVDSCRYLPLHEIMPEWNNIATYHARDEKFDIEIVEELVMILGNRIFGFSVIIEEILCNNDDPFLPLWREMNICLQIDKFFAAQSAAATLFGLIRDTRCVSSIKSISSNLERTNFIEAFGNLVSKFGDDALFASVLLIPFVHSEKINSSDRGTSMSRNGTVHKGMDYFSKFNTLGMVLSLCYLIKRMYKYGSLKETELNDVIFKAQNRWQI